MQPSPKDPIHSRMEELTAGLPSKSAKIRRLAAAGYTKSQTAKFLGIIYQHVYNVLAADEKKGQTTGIPSPSADTSFKTGFGAAKVAIGPDGAIVLPSHILTAAGVAAGQRLLVRFEDDEIKLMTPEVTARKVQAAIREFVPPGVSLVDELLKERRREADGE